MAERAATREREPRIENGVFADRPTATRRAARSTSRRLTAATIGSSADSTTSERPVVSARAS